MIGASKEAQIIQMIEATQEVILDQVFYIYYLIQFVKDKVNV